MTRNPWPVTRHEAADEPIVCRCEEITLSQVERAIAEGYDTLEELKRHLRAGMGPCQGRTCLPLLARILARKTGRPLEQVFSSVSVRPPLAPAPVTLFLGGEDEG
ncbi:TPA: (2Fe-2S)-binding protein [Candidatus Bipolaricaulota bacterium]|nr:(2Fe-2S)-binding protein [Candidatus Bipolaricaulota bacterium]